MRSTVVRRRSADDVASVAALGHQPLLSGIGATFVLALLLSVILTVILVPAAGAAEISATQMKVAVWPEYDDPRVLAILQADLDPGVQLPAEITFNIPKGAEVGMACEVNSAGGHACKPYRLEDKGDYQTLTYTVDTEKKVFLEYYYEAFPTGTAQRNFDFVYRPSFAVASTTVEVQEPLRSTGFSVDPALPQTYKDSEGLSYHSQEYAGLPVGEPLAVSVAYSKPDAEPSVQKEDAGGEPPSGSTAAGEGGTNSTLLAVLGVVALGAVSLGGYRVLRPASASSGGRRRGAGRPTRSQEPRGSNRGAAARNSKAGAAGTGSKAARRGGATSKFCTACGSELQRKDNFCPDCGEAQD